MLLFTSQSEKCSDKRSRENKNTFSVQYNFLRNSTLYEIKWILCTVEPDTALTIKYNVDKMHEYRRIIIVVKCKELDVKLHVHLRYRSG